MSFGLQVTNSPRSFAAGGKWLIAVAAVTPFVINTVQSNIANTSDWRPDIDATIKMTFPDLAGGGSGLLLCDEQEPLAGSHPIPFAVDAASLKNTALTLGGVPIPGFPINLVIAAIENNPPFHTYHTIQNAIALKMVGPLAKPFTLKMNAIASNGNTQGALQVALYKGGIIKVGTIIGADPDDPSSIGRPIPNATDVKFFGTVAIGPAVQTATTSTDASFAIDPTKLTVKVS